jgi:hypothetical protein
MTYSETRELPQGSSLYYNHRRSGRGRRASRSCGRTINAVLGVRIPLRPLQKTSRLCRDVLIAVSCFIHPAAAPRITTQYPPAGFETAHKNPTFFY